MRPDHCKGCVHFHCAGRIKPGKEMVKYNKWCCAKGAPVEESIGWCKLHRKKKIKDEETKTCHE